MDLKQPDLRWYDYLRSLVGMLLFIIIFTLLIPIVSLLLIISFGRLSNWFIEEMAPPIARFILYVLGIRFTITSVDQGRLDYPAIYIVNHASTLDILTILALGIKRVRFVAKWELQYFPFFFFLGRLTGQIFIQRQNREKAVQTLQKSYRNVLKHKYSIFIAPEGTRKHEMPIGAFKKGAFRMALDLNYPIVPIYFDGNARLSKGGSVFTKSGNITSFVHPPISIAHWKEEELEVHIQDIRNKYLEWSTR